jgi:hypothetical protein
MLLGIVAATAVHIGIMISHLVFLTTGVDLIIHKFYMARFRYPKQASLIVILQGVRQKQGAADGIRDCPQDAPKKSVVQILQSP